MNVYSEILPSRAITRLTGIRHRFSAGRKKSRTKGRYEIHGVLGGISVFTDYQRRLKIGTPRLGEWTPPVDIPELPGYPWDESGQT